VPHVSDHEGAILNTEVGVREVGQDGDDLVLVSECGDEGTHGFASPEVMQQLQLVLNPEGAARHVDLLQRDIFGFPAVSGPRPAAVVTQSPSFRRRSRPFIIFIVLVKVPIIVLVVIIKQVFRLVHG